MSLFDEEVGKETQGEPLQLGVQLDEVDVTRPCLQGGDHVMTVKSITQVPKSDDPNTKLGLVIFQTKNVETSVQGKDVKPGHQIRAYWRISPSEKNPDWDWRQNWKRLKIAATGNGNGQFDPAEIVGKDVVVVTSVDASDPDQPRENFKTVKKLVA